MCLFLFCILLISTNNILSMETDLTHPLTHLSQSLYSLEKELRSQKTVEANEPTKLHSTRSITLRPLYPQKSTLVTSIVQFRVLQQAYNANCGYHALKDTLYIIKALENDEFKKNLHTYLTNETIYQTDYKEWSKVIAQERKTDDTQWLDGQELENLYSKHTPEKPQDTLIWTIDNIDWISQKYHYQGLITTPGFDILKNFRHLPTYQAGFLINNASEYTTKEGSQKTTSGHWFGIVVEKKQNQFFYYITDSLNRDRTNDSKVLLLKKFLEQDNIITIEIVITLNPEMDSLKTSFMPKALRTDIDQKYNIISTLSKIKSIIEIAQEKHFIQTDEFNENRNILLDYLEKIEDTKKTTEEDLQLTLEEQHITTHELREALVNIN